jgi:hypothetical protein
MDDQLKTAHTHSSHHRSEIEASSQCGCFNCCSVFAPTEIDQWCHDEQTAVCPRCSIDSVIGDASNLQVQDMKFLKRMKVYWF